MLTWKCERCTPQHARGSRRIASKMRSARACWIYIEGACMLAAIRNRLRFKTKVQFAVVIPDPVLFTPCEPFSLRATSSLRQHPPSACRSVVSTPTACVIRCSSGFLYFSQRVNLSACVPPPVSVSTLLAPVSRSQAQPLRDYTACMADPRYSFSMVTSCTVSAAG